MIVLIGDAVLRKKSNETASRSKMTIYRKVASLTYIVKLRSSVG